MLDPVTPQPTPSGLHRSLGAVKMATFAIGGAIGTGLFLGSGAALPIAGPAAIVSYVLGALLSLAVAMAMGELAVRHPQAGAFGVAADAYLGPWAGFVVRSGYWVCMLLSVAADLVACSTYIRFWAPNVPAAFWIVIITAALLLMNLADVSRLGTVEYWLAALKVITIIVFVIIGTALLTTGGVQPQFTTGGGFFPHGARGVLLAVPFALFSFLGIEFVAVSSGEARDPRAIRNATLITLGGLMFLYLGAMAVLAGVVPSANLSTAESPFVTLFRAVGVPFATTLVNVVVLTAALSGSNASLYVCSRTIYSLALAGDAPQVFGRTNAEGVPVAAVFISCLGAIAALLVTVLIPSSAYLYIVGIGLCGGMLVWMIGLAAHIRLRRLISAGKVEDSAFRAPGGAVVSAIALLGIFAAMVGTFFLPDLRIAILSGIPYVAVLSIAYLVMKSRKRASS
jgi:AAT family amino acid transporter